VKCAYGRKLPRFDPERERLNDDDINDHPGRADTLSSIAGYVGIVSMLNSQLQPTQQRNRRS
jgi:hypothetical protein